MMRLLSCTLLAGGLAAGAEAAPRVWAEHPLGAVDVGWEAEANSAVRAAAFLAVLGPEIEDEWDAKAVRTCATSIGGLSETASLKIESAKSVEATLVDLVKAGGNVTAASFNAERKKRSDDIASRLAKEVDDKRAQLFACMPGKYGAGTFQVGVVFRTCPPVAGKDHPCAALASMAAESARRRASAFVNVADSFYERGAVAYGSVYTVTAPGIPFAKLESLQDATRWKEPSTAEAIARFEALALRVRDLNKLPAQLKEPLTIHFAVPRAIGLTQDTAARVLDVLASPSEAMRPLGRGIQALNDLSDEVARTRILECSRLRGLDNLAQISDCAGYKLDPGQLAECMNARRCLPQIEAKAWASLVAITDSLDLQGLAAGSMFARMQDGWSTYGKYEAAARACAQAADSATDDQAYQQAAGLCLIQSGLVGTKERELYACVSAAKRDSARLMDCAVSAAGGDLGQAYACWKESGTEPLDVALCAGRGKIDPKVLQCVDGYREGGAEGAVKACLLAALPSDEARMAACIADNPKNRSAAAVCLVSPSLSPKEAAALKCAQEQAGDWGAMAGCAAAPYIAGMAGGDLGRALQCGLQSGGDPLGTTVCMASGDLNPTQQILLQCAAVSPDGLTFATCAGGQLAFKEFMHCREVKFGADKCFGPNNEIRRLVRNLGLGDINENTLVAKYFNAHLEYYKFQVALAEDSLKVLGKLGEQVFTVGNNVKNEIERGVGKVYKAARKWVKRICKWC